MPTAPWTRLASLLLLLTGLGACLDDLEDDRAPMTVELVTPQRVQQGQLVTLLGRFPDQPTRTHAWVSGVCTSIHGWTPEEVVVRVPRGAGLGERLVVLQADGAFSDPAHLQIVGTDQPADRISCDEGPGD